MSNVTPSPVTNTQNDAQPQLISPKTLAYIQQLLNDKPLFFYFENDIEVRFYAKRAEEYRRLLSIGKLLFFVLYGIITFIALSIFPSIVMAEDQFIFKFVLVPIGLLLLLVLAIAELPIFQRNYQWLATPIQTSPPIRRNGNALQLHSNTWRNPAKGGN